MKQLFLLSLTLLSLAAFGSHYRGEAVLGIFENAKALSDLTANCLEENSCNTQRMNQKVESIEALYQEGIGLTEREMELLDRALGGMNSALENEQLDLETLEKPDQTLNELLRVMTQLM